MEIEKLIEELEKDLKLDSEAHPPPWGSFENGPWGGQGFGVNTTKCGEQSVSEWFVAEAYTDTCAADAQLIERMRNTHRGTKEALILALRALQYCSKKHNRVATKALKEIGEVMKNET
jgi:hypothetical protein